MLLLVVLGIALWIPAIKSARCYVDQLDYPGLEKTRRVYRDGSSFAVACGSGYELSQPNSRFVCKSGTWEGPVPPCIGAAGEEVTPEGINNYEDNLDYGDYEDTKVQNPETDDAIEEGTTSSLPSPTEGLSEHRKFEEKPHVLKATNTTTKAECSCIYSNQDAQVVGFSDDRELEYGNRVKLGESVKFHCRDLGHRRLDGSPELKCKSCETWRQPDFPICLDPQWGDTTIVIDTKKTRILPGGVIGIREGDSFEIPCYGSDNYRTPVWSYHGLNFPPRITITSYGIVGYNVVSMKIERAGAIHTGTYVCLIPGQRPTNLQLKVLDEEKQCGAFKEDVHIIHYDKDRKVNSSAWFYCRKMGYRPVGSNVLNCLPSGKWSDSPPECKGSDCPEIVETEGMKISLTDELHVGSTAMFHCFLPRRWIGPSHIRCEMGGIWSGSVPSCSRVTCPALSETEGMKISYSDYQNVGSKATFQCTPPRTLNGAAHAQCNRNRKWSRSPPFCKKVTCADIDNTADMEISYSDNLNVGSETKFQCTPPLTLTGPYRIKCEINGTWSRAPPFCKRIDCPEIGKIEGMEITFSNELHKRGTAKFHCFPPRTLTGASQIRCKADGTWSGPVPHCSLSACTLESLFEVVPDNVVPVLEDITSDEIPYNSSLSLTCDGNMVLLGNSAAKCGGLGQWEVSKVQCVLGCSPLEKPPSSQVIIEPKKAFYRLGDFMFYKCPDGLTLIPDVERVLCLGDRWSESRIPECLVEATSLSTV